MSTTQTLRLVAREIAQLNKNPPEGVRVRFDEDNLLGSVEGLIEGPAGTPYEGGYFRVRFDFVDVDFPNMPPKCTMLTKIFHPNISKQGGRISSLLPFGKLTCAKWVRSGEICVDTLKKGWKREYGIGHVLVTIKCLFIVPNPESALDEEAGKLLLEEYESYYKMAKLMTSIHATPKRPPPEFVTPGAPSSTIPVASTSRTTGPSVQKSPSGGCSPSGKRTHSPAPSLTSAAGRPPQPLQTHLQQGQVANQIPAADGKGLIGGGGMTSAPAPSKTTGPKLQGGVKTASGKPAAGTTSGAASKAKRGLKRL